jgi:phosphate transport system substrate-binding protein
MSPTLRYWLLTLLLGLVGVPLLVSVVGQIVLIALLEAGVDAVDPILAAVTAVIAAALWYGWAGVRSRPQSWVHAWLPVLIPPVYFLLAWVVIFGVTGLAFGDSYQVVLVSHAPYFLLMVAVMLLGATQLLPTVLITAALVTTAAFGVGSWRRVGARLTRPALALVSAVALGLGSVAGGQLVMAKANADRLATGPVVSQEVDLSSYRPFEAGNRLVVPAERPALQLSADFPVLDGATAAYPIYAAMGQAIYQLPSGLDEEGRYQFVSQYLDCTNTTGGYQRLIDGEADVFFGAQPSTAQRAAAQQAGRTLSLTPVAREAFVIFVNQGNPVSNLTSDQLRAIYTRRLTNWSQVGGTDEPILAFQRPENSGSQTIMEAKVMNGQPMAAPLKEETAAGMGDILSQVADYRNAPGAIGYSFRWYATVMNAKAGLKLLSIDGVAPTAENIRNGSYPFTVDVHAVTAGTTNSNVPGLIDWVRSAEGQSLIEQVGYVGLK